MTLATHAIAGAALATLVPGHPIFAFALGFASHFPLDAIPHWDYPIYSDAIHPRKTAAMKMDRALVRDALDFSFDAGLGILVSFFFFGSATAALVILCGALGGILPDPLQFVAKKVSWAPIQTLQRFHKWIHTPYRLREMGYVTLGIVSQLALVAVIIIAAKSTALF